MRRWVWIAVAMLLAALVAFPEGKKEAPPEGEGVKIIFGFEGPETPSPVYGDKGRFKDYLIPRFIKETGIQVEVREYQGGGAGGSTTEQIDAEMTGGSPPDVLFGYYGRMNKFANSRYAWPINGVSPSDYNPGTLEMFSKGGKVWALPETSWMTIMPVNVDLIAKAGFERLIPPKEVLNRTWKLEDYDKMIRSVRALGPDTYGLVILAANTGGDYWVTNWLSAFGSPFVKEGRVVVDNPQGRECLTWLRSLVVERLLPEGSVGIAVAEMKGMYLAGQAATMGGVPGDIDTGPKSANPPFRSSLMSFPTRSGQAASHVIGPDCAVVVNNSDPVKAAAAEKLAKYITGSYAQEFQVRGYRFPSLASLTVPADNYGLTIANEVLKRGGTFDVGMSSPGYGKIRTMWLEHLQKILDGKETPEAGLAAFQRDTNKALGW